MSYGLDPKARQRRQQQPNPGLLFYALRTAVSAAAVVAIAYALDVPKLLREKYSDTPPAAAQQQPKKPPAPLAQPSRPQTPPTVRRSAPNLFADASANTNLTPEPSPQRQNDKIVIPKPELQPALPPLDNLHAPPRQLEAADDQFLVLDLEKKLSRVRISEVPPTGKALPHVRVTGLQKSESEFELDPPDGDINAWLYVRFQEYPRVRIVVRTDKIGQNVFLTSEPQWDIGANKPAPFTLNEVHQAAFAIHREADSFLATLAAYKQELETLQKEIKPGTGLKTLAYVKWATKRIEELKELIKVGDARVDAVKQGVEEVDALEHLANSLHNKAELHFELVDDN